jgi:hypothetical protein
VAQSQRKCKDAVQRFAFHAGLPQKSSHHSLACIADGSGLLESLVDLRLVTDAAGTVPSEM